MSGAVTADEPSGAGPAGAPAASLASGRPTGRNPYSSDVVTDPYVLEQQLAIVEAMERSCRQLGENCREARQARRYIDEQAK